MTDKKRGTTLKTMQFSWPMVFIMLALILGAFVGGMKLNQQDGRRLRERESTLQYNLSRRETSMLELQQELDNVGSNAYIETRARAEYHYLKPGELRFEVVNADQLDSYTEEEWQIVLDEMAWDDED